MPLVYTEQERQPSFLETMGLFNQMFGNIQGLQERGANKFASEVAFGKPGAGLDVLTNKGAPGLDPSLAGPSLAMTQGGMAQPGLFDGGTLSKVDAQKLLAGGGWGQGLAQWAIGRKLAG
jgi:hypothetical protein